MTHDGINRSGILCMMENIIFSALLYMWRKMSLNQLCFFNSILININSQLIISQKYSVFCNVKQRKIIDNNVKRYIYITFKTKNIQYLLQKFLKLISSHNGNNVTKKGIDIIEGHMKMSHNLF